MKKSAKKKSKKDTVTYYLFYCNCGQSRNKEIRGFHSRFTQEDIDDELIRWCETFGFWNVSEKLITYGTKEIKIPGRKYLLKKWSPLCKERERKLTISGK